MNSLRWGKVRIPSSCMLMKHHDKFALDQTSKITSSLGSSTDTKGPLVSLLIVWGEANSGFDLVVWFLSIMSSLPQIRQLKPSFTLGGWPLNFFLFCQITNRQKDFLQTKLPQLYHFLGYLGVYRWRRKSLPGFLSYRGRFWKLVELLLWHSSRIHLLWP